MVIAVDGLGTQGNSGSTATTTVSFITPSVVSITDVWMLSVACRGGSSMTVSGVPAGFHLVSRVDAGSVSSNVVLITYWYVPTGVETAGTSFGTITLSASSKYATSVIALSGTNIAAPAVMSTVTGVATTGPTGVLPALSSGQAAYAVGGEQGSTAGVIIGDGSPVTVSYEIGSVTSGGSAATNVSVVAAVMLAADDAGSYPWSIVSGSGTTNAVLAFVMSPAASVVYADRVRHNTLLRR